MILVSDGSTLEEPWTYNPMIQGLNPSMALERENDWIKVI